MQHLEGGTGDEKNDTASTTMEIEETEDAGTIGNEIAFMPLAGPPTVTVMLLDEDCEEGEEDKRFQFQISRW